jgi:hypothetical protein
MDVLPDPPNDSDAASATVASSGVTPKLSSYRLVLIASAPCVVWFAGVSKSASACSFSGHASVRRWLPTAHHSREIEHFRWSGAMGDSKTGAANLRSTPRSTSPG